jgi:hypothetical protein
MKIPNIRSRKEQRHKQYRHLRYLAEQQKTAQAMGLNPPKSAIHEVQGLLKRG